MKKTRIILHQIQALLITTKLNNKTLLTPPQLFTARCQPWDFHQQMSINNGTYEINRNSKQNNQFHNHTHPAHQPGARCFPPPHRASANISNISSAIIRLLTFPLPASNVPSVCVRDVSRCYWRKIQCAHLQKGRNNPKHPKIEAATFQLNIR